MTRPNVPGGNALALEDGARVLVGIGVSHGPLVDQLREPGIYQRPLSAMQSFLDALDHAQPPLPAGARVLAALGPKMLALAAERAAGAHQFLVTPQHTAKAREILGPDALLAPEQGVVLETDPDRARAIARNILSMYFQYPNYVNSWRTEGFTDDDVAAPGSDRLIDALYAWGDEDAIAQRIRQHQEAGVDHVAIQVLTDREDIGIFPTEQLPPRTGTHDPCALTFRQGASATDTCGICSDRCPGRLDMRRINGRSSGCLTSEH